MLEIKTMTVEEFMNTKCDTVKLSAMYRRLSQLKRGEYASRFDWSEKPLYEANGRIYGGGDCVEILSHREGYGYTIISVGDRGDWMCCVYPKPEIKYECIAFYDGEDEEVFKKLAGRWGV